MSSSLVSSQLLRVIVQIGEQNLGVGSLLWVGLKDFGQLQASSMQRCCIQRCCIHSLGVGTLSENGVAERKRSDSERREENFNSDRRKKEGELRKLTNMYGLSLPRGGWHPGVRQDPPKSFWLDHSPRRLLLWL